MVSQSAEAALKKNDQWKKAKFKSLPGLGVKPCSFYFDNTPTSYPTKIWQPRHGDNQNNDTQHVSRIGSDECRNSVQHAECRGAAI